MRLLVLGGTRFVGRALAAEGLARDWSVTTLHRGRTGSPPAGARTVVADRTDPAALARAVDDVGPVDLVVDTWSGAPSVAGLAAGLLRGWASRLGYVSSISVYRWGEHVDESSPLVEGSADADATDYAADKRGAELAVQAIFPDAVLARAGLVLGPHEDVGRLPWWLERAARGGPMLAPGRPGRPLQYVDARDLAGWLLDALQGEVAGPVDVVSRSGHATTASLLSACVDATGGGARLVWVDEPALAAAGAQPWTQLPCWVPESGETAGFLEGNSSRAADLGLRCRPVAATVIDTWAWLRSGSAVLDRTHLGLPAALEDRLLADHRSEEP